MYGIEGLMSRRNYRSDQTGEKIFLSLLHKKLVFFRYEYVCRKTWFYMCNGESKAHP